MTVCDCVGRRRERRGWSRGRSAPRLSSLSSSDAVVSRCGVGHGPCCAGPKIESGPAFLRALTHPPLGFVAHFHPPCPTVLSLRPRTCTDAGHRERLVIADTNLLPGHPDIRPVAGGSSLPTARGLGLREHVRGVVPLPGPDRSLVLPVCSPHGSYLQRHSSPQTGYVGITSSRLYRPVWITQRYGFRQDSGAVALRPPCKSWTYKCLPPRRKGALHQSSRLLPNTNLRLCTRHCLLPTPTTQAPSTAPMPTCIICLSDLRDPAALPCGE